MKEQEPMEKRKPILHPISRRGFIKLLTVTLGTSMAAPLIASCAPAKEDEYEVDIVIEQGELHYSPDKLTIPTGAKITWLNKSYYSQSAICDPKMAGSGDAVNLPQGAQPWNSGILYQIGRASCRER